MSDKSSWVASASSPEYVHPDNPSGEPYFVLNAIDGVKGVGWKEYTSDPAFSQRHWLSLDLGKTVNVVEVYYLAVLRG